ncbi:MAG: hypothetical protein LBG88_01285 [Christensenellaceae bacterium]|nr:hypothetical protein [Christensenellaceae bacterium]
MSQLDDIKGITDKIEVLERLYCGTLNPRDRERHLAEIRKYQNSHHEEIQDAVKAALDCCFEEAKKTSGRPAMTPTNINEREQDAVDKVLVAARNPDGTLNQNVIKVMAQRYKITVQDVNARVAEQAQARVQPQPQIATPQRAVETQRVVTAGKEEEMEI